MASGKKSFMFYCDWKETFESLPDEKAGELIKHVLRYVNDENPETDDILIKAVFANIKATLKRDLKKWEKIVERNRKNGALGGRPPVTQQNPDNPVGFLGTQNNPEKPDSDSDSDSDKDSVKEKKGIEVRIGEFRNSLLPFVGQYDKILLKEFFGYWTEHGPKDRKFRAEKEKSFDTEKRLERWLKNQKRFEKEKSSAKKEKVPADQIARNIIYGTSKI